MRTKANSFSPSQQGVCGRHDLEELSMTPGELAVLSRKQRDISDPISPKRNGE